MHFQKFVFLAKMIFFALRSLIVIIENVNLRINSILISSVTTGTYIFYLIFITDKNLFQFYTHFTNYLQIISKMFLFILQYQIYKTNIFMVFIIIHIFLKCKSNIPKKVRLRNRVHFINLFIEHIMKFSEQ